MLFSISRLRLLLTAMCVTVFDVSVQLQVVGGLHVVSTECSDRTDKLYGVTWQEIKGLVAHAILKVQRYLDPMTST